MQTTACQAEGTGWAIWDGAVVMARYIDKSTENGWGRDPDFLLWTMDCLELGAGTGLAGIAASRCLTVRAACCAAESQADCSVLQISDCTVLQMA
jgi:predicted nicotinamide N-methyase